MSMHLRREVERLHDRLMALCAGVEKRVAMATRAIEERDADLARQVIESDAEIDAQEVILEEEGLKILALHQPVAIDLRIIVATIKMNADLERIGDYARTIAKRALTLADQDVHPERFGFSAMSAKVIGQLRNGLDALVRLDVEQAWRVVRGDREIDAMNRETASRVEAAIREDPARTHALLQLIAVARALERIGDHATNIAEDVIYMASGEIVRHHRGTRAETGTDGGAL